MVHTASLHRPTAGQRTLPTTSNQIPRSGVKEDHWLLILSSSSRHLLRGLSRCLLVGSGLQKVVILAHSYFGHAADVASPGPLQLSGFLSNVSNLCLVAQCGVAYMVCQQMVPNHIRTAHQHIRTYTYSICVYVCRHSCGLTRVSRTHCGEYTIRPQLSYAPKGTEQLAQRNVLGKGSKLY